MTNDPEIIRAVARKILGPSGQAGVEVCLVDDGPVTAFWAVIGAIDGRMWRGKITMAEADALYSELGTNREELIGHRLRKLN